MDGPGTNANARKPSPDRSEPPPKKPKRDVNNNDELTLSPITSENDPNEYEVMTLKNGLTILLISRKKRKAPTSGESGTNSSSKAMSDDYLTDKEPWLRDMKVIDHLSKSDASLIGTSPLPLFPQWVPSSGPLFYHHDQQYSPWNFEERDDNSGGLFDRQTAVALVVSVGGLRDPAVAVEDHPLCYQGMAHFMEHMVHYGSQKFRREQDVNMIVSNFGSYNACTSDNMTSYYNQVPDFLLERNLELFSEMLTHPLFTPGTLAKEVNAVDNEMYLRLPMLQKFLLHGHVAFNGHPMENFLCGNLKTLTGCKDDQGNKMSKEMTRHHRDFYHATAMTLCISSTKSIIELKDLAKRHFSQLLEGNQQLHHKRGEEPLQPEHLNYNGKLVYCQGDTSLSLLSFQWCLPPSLWLDPKNSAAKVVEMMERLFSHSSRKGLDAVLRSEGLTHSLMAGALQNHHVTLFHLDLALTSEGRSKTKEISQHVFAFISAMAEASKDEMERFFTEVEVSNLRRFHYNPETNVMEMTKECACNLQFEGKLENVLCRDSWLDAEFNHKAIQEAFRSMKMKEKLIVIETVPKEVKLADLKKRIESSQIPIHKDDKEPHSKTEFFITELEDQFLKAPTHLRKKFSVPPENSLFQKGFVSTPDEVRGTKESGDCPGFEWICPKNYGDISIQRMTYKSKSDPEEGDDMNCSGSSIPPKISGIHLGHSENGPGANFLGKVTIYFLSPFVLDPTPMRTAAKYLWTFITAAKLRHLKSDFELAGYDFSVMSGSVVSLRGIPGAFDRAVEVILDQMLNSPITQQELEHAKLELKRWQERQTSVASEIYIANSILNSITYPSSPLNLTEPWDTAKDITLKELKEEIIAFRNSTYCNVYLMGNVPVSLFHKVAAILDTHEFQPRYFFERSMLLPNCFTHPMFLTPGEKCIRVKNENSNSYTTLVKNVYILGNYKEGTPTAQRFDLAMSFLRTAAFMELRTNKQLGYLVRARNLLDLDLPLPIMMFSVEVVGTAKKFTACELDAEIDQFVSEYGKYVKTGIDQDIFDIMVQVMKEKVPVGVTKSEVGEWFANIFGGLSNSRKSSYSQDVNGIDYLVSKQIRKVSIQVLTSNPRAETKPCGHDCKKCNSLEWVPLQQQHGTGFLCAKGTDQFEEYFQML